MRKLFLISFLAIGALFVGCEKDTNVGADLTWTDSDYFDLNDDWKASVYRGAIAFVDEEDYEKSALETKDVSVGDENVVFEVSISTVENFTIVVFNDLNENDKYDAGENAAVSFATFDAGESKNVELDINY